MDEQVINRNAPLRTRDVGGEREATRMIIPTIISPYPIPDMIIPTTNETPFSTYARYPAVAHLSFPNGVELSSRQKHARHDDWIRVIYAMIIPWVMNS